MRRLAIAIALIPATAYAGGEEFSYNEPGDLVPGSGEGAADYTVYAPGMRYPIENGPSYPNSQVWGAGGSNGGGGSQCDAVNYSYPWSDNYCETRSWDMPLCPSGVGHQGQDIRPGTCDDMTHWQVASEAGEVTNIGSYSVYVTTAGGQRFDWLHGGGNIVSVGQDVAKGERLNLVSNEFGGTSTTIHLHFNIRQDVAGVGFVYVSPYMSLVESYMDLLGISPGNGVGSASTSGCEAIEGWAQDADEPEASIPVQIYFGGPSDDANAVGVEVIADVHDDALCDELGSCEHAFSVEIPRSLRDGTEQVAHVYAVVGGGTAEVESSPTSFSCAAPDVPNGVRREAPPGVIAAWGLSPFWDAATLDAADLEAIEEGEPFPEEPVLVRSDDPDDDGTIWLMDPGYRRAVSEAAAEAWGLDLGQVAQWPADVLNDVAEGTPLRSDVFLVQSDSMGVHVIDDAQCPPDEECDPPGGTGGDGDGDGGDGGDGGGPGGNASGTDGGDALPDGDLDDGGCGCRHAPPASWLSLLLLLGLRRRRVR